MRSPSGVLGKDGESSEDEESLRSIREGRGVLRRSGVPQKMRSPSGRCGVCQEGKGVQGKEGESSEGAESFRNVQGCARDKRGVLRRCGVPLGT